MFLTKRMKPSHLAKSWFSINAKKWNTERTLYEVVLLNRKLLEEKRFLKSEINNDKNNKKLANHGFPTIEVYNKTYHFICMNIYMP